MSYTTIYEVHVGERVREIDEFSNASFSGPIVWNKIIPTFLGKSWYGDPGVDWAEAFALAQNDEVPMPVRWVLAFTADAVYVEKADFKLFAGYIREFFCWYPCIGEKKTYDRMWMWLADMLESDLDSPAIGMRCTSVQGNPFLNVRNEDGTMTTTDWEKVHNIREAVAYGQETET